MKYTTLVYAVMLLVCGGGLWAILRHGNELSTVADLGGSWTIESDSGPLGPGSAGPEHLGDTFHIEQSGRFIRIRFESGRLLDLRAAEIPTGRIGPTPTPIELADKRWKLTGTLHQEGQSLVGLFSLQGPRPAQFVAYRTPPEVEGPPPITNDVEPAPAPEGPGTQPVAIAGSTKPATQPHGEPMPADTGTRPATVDLPTELD